MRKGIILLELIFTIVIVSIISIFSMTVLYNLFDKFSKDYKKEIIKLELSNTQILLDKIFSNTINLQIKSNSITFDLIDTKLFNLGYYSKFIDLNSSTKTTIFSPNAKAEKLIDYAITFDDKTIYEIKNDSFGEIINLESNELKTIKEQYKIISKKHKLTCNNSELNLDNNLLLNNITSCNFSLDSKALIIEIKVDDTPSILKYKL